LVYFVANIKIEDETEYNKYLDSVDEVFAKFNGKYLSVDNNPKILEGEWKYTKTVIIQFNNEEEFNNWYYSNEYQSILINRLKGAVCDTILIKGN